MRFTSLILFAVLVLAGTFQSAGAEPEPGFLLKKLLGGLFGGGGHHGGYDRGHYGHRGHYGNYGPYGYY